jgi:hypothetical protein
MKNKILLALVLLNGHLCLAQNLNNVQYPQMLKVSVRREIKMPDIPGYHTFKCDFHMHTIFSDGIVWPTFRVDEAWEEGLDAIAITDHIENQPSKIFVAGDHNSSYEIARDYAIEKNILLIKSGEIKRKMPPGHLNAIFVDNVNLLDVADPVEALRAAKKQGAFVMWNHPGWKAQQPDTCKWWSMHQNLYEEGLINGIEVFNEQEYYPIVLDWCINRNLAVIGNSDIHGIIASTYDLEKGYRPMTLVFAKDRSIESIREALFSNRTLAFFNNKLAGKEEYLQAVLKAAVTIKATGRFDSKKREYYEIKNNSAIPFEIRKPDGDLLSIPSEALIVMTINTEDFQNITIQNLITGSGSVLKLKSIF